MATPHTSRYQERAAMRAGASPEVARGFAGAALTKKAIDLVILDLRKLTSVTDFFIVGTVSTDVHSRAVEGAVKEWAKDELGQRPWHVEGAEGTRNWVLLDYIDVVVHLFLPDARAYYTLERLWGDAPMEEIRDPEQGNHAAP
ncbi:MAG: ribosome silencing factor [Candidatus Latescibacteria bacterium]|nr:ribosome silencing factor [Candidatus Latescibacterota bacterium]